MQVECRPGQNITIPSVPNLRDLGGWSTREGGRVRTGLLYRSTALDRLAGEDAAAFAALGIRSVFDLRTEAERRAQPDRLPPGTEHFVVDVLGDSAVAAPAQILKAEFAPKMAEEMLSGGKAVALYEGWYREAVSLPCACSGYHRLFSSLAQEERRPALFHCTTGKDRTGWTAAAMLLLLGVPHDEVMEDYLLTNAQLLPAKKPLFDEFAARGGNPDLLLPVLGARPEYLEAALDELHKRHGTVEAYFAEGLGVDAATQHALRAAFIEGI